MACELNDDEFSIDSVAVEAWDDKSVDDRPMRHLSRDKEINANTGKAKEKKMCSRSYGTSRILKRFIPYTFLYLYICIICINTIYDR